MSIGIGYCVLEYSQAKASAGAMGYQPSASLARALAGLTDSFSTTQRVVGAFNTDHQLTTPNVPAPHFPTVVGANADFAAVDEALSNVDRQRELLKQSIVSRFETLVGGIETKLRAYAAGVKGAASAEPSPSQPTGTVVVTTAAPAEGQAKTEGSVFSPKLNLADMTKRGSDLNAQMEFLEVLKSKAEKPAESGEPDRCGGATRSVEQNSYPKDRSRNRPPAGRARTIVILTVNSCLRNVLLFSYSSFEVR